MNALKKTNLTVRILIALALGLLVGLVFKEKAAVLQPIGDIFLSLIKMLVVPLIMCTIINSVSDMKNTNILGRVGVKSLVLYLITTVAAAALGIFFATVARVGEGVRIVETAQAANADPLTAGSVVQNIVPTNIFASMANFQVLPCIVFSLLFGLAMIVLGEKADPVKKVISSATEIIYTLVGLIIKIAPVGVFALIASGIGTNGAEVFSALGVYVIIIYVTGISLLFFYALMVRFGGGMSLSKFVKASTKVFVTAFTTRSSNVTLPLVVKTAVEDLDVKREIAEFTLPVAANLNSNGAVMAMGASAVLAAFIYDSPLTITQIAIAIAISTISGMGMPGVPNSGMVFNIFLFTSLGFPAGALIAMIASVEAMTDMMCTAINVVGDLVCAVVVNKSEKARDQKILAAIGNKLVMEK